MNADWKFPTPRYHFLDIWMALGGDPLVFDAWIEHPKRTPADAWHQLLGAIRGDLPGLLADTNPPAGELVDVLLANWKRVLNENLRG